MIAACRMSRQRRWLPMAALVSGLAAGSAAAAEDSALAVTQIAPGVYVHQGSHAEIAEANRGAIANLGFVVGERCVAVIDTGGAPATGRALRRAVRQVTRLPVCHVINTHVHPDHWLGNSAFEDDQPEFIGHARLPAQLAARGPYYIAALQRDTRFRYGPDALVPPTRTVTDALELDLGGRRLRLEAMPPAHTDNDLVVTDLATGTLWLSDLLFVDRVPSLDGSLKGWLAVLDRLQGRDAARAVPGHGPASVAWPEAAAPLRRYLEALLDQTRAAITAGATLEEALERVAAAEAGNWKLFQDYHPRNVGKAYAELEWE